MESSDSINKDSHSYFSEYVFFSKLETQHNIHMWSIIRNFNLKTETVEGEADMETVSCAFSFFVYYCI